MDISPTNMDNVPRGDPDSVPDLPLLDSTVKLVFDPIELNEAFPDLVQHEATALLLDVNNLYKLAKANGFSLDYIKLKEILSRRCDLRYCAAFTAIDQSDPQSINFAQLLYDHGYDVVSRDLLRYTTDDGTVVTKGNMDILMTIHAMNLPEAFGHIIIGTCDGDFADLVKELSKNPFRKVSVMGIKGPDWKGISKNLMRSGKNFYNLYDIRNLISHQGRRHDNESHL